MTEMKSIVWMANVRLVVHSLTSSSIGKVLELPDGCFVPTELIFVSSFSLFVG